MSTSIAERASSAVAAGREEEEILLAAQTLARGLTLPMVLKSAVLELKLLDIISAAGDDAWLSPSEIAEQLPSKTEETAAMLDRMLGFLACYSVVNCKIQKNNDEGEESRLYGMARIGKLYTDKQDGHDSPFRLFMMLHHDRQQVWSHLTDAVLHGGTPFARLHGMPVYKYQQLEENQHTNKLFNQTMFGLTTLTMKKVLNTYKGFEKINTLVDVGGGSGATLSAITSQYPHMKGINFDLPHVVKSASTYPGVENVGGDMFEKVPTGDAIFMKWILHNWSDENCIKILKNCHKALPETGIVIVIEQIVPTVPSDDPSTVLACQQDVTMLVTTGGKGKTSAEYATLARKSGFHGFKAMYCGIGYSVMEFHKKAI